MRTISSKSSLLVPPSLHNSSCSHPRYGPVGPTASLGGLVQGTIILTLFVGIIVANLLVIIVINSRRYSKYIHAQVRHQYCPYLLTLPYATRYSAPCNARTTSPSPLLFLQSSRSWKSSLTLSIHRLFLFVPFSAECFYLPSQAIFLICNLFHLSKPFQSLLCLN